jgi:hypothetical protein
LDVLKSIDEVKATLGALWETAEKYVAERSDTNMLALAPGEEVLKAVWQLSDSAATPRRATDS